jgi:hypothetical protein
MKNQPIIGDASSCTGLLVPENTELKPRRLLEPEDFNVPETFDKLEDAIIQAEFDGIRSMLRKAHLITVAREREFSKDSAAWKEWAERVFGYKPRYADRCLSVGRFLHRVIAPSLPGFASVAAATVGQQNGRYLKPEIAMRLIYCEDMDKLEILAHIPSEALPVLFSKVDPSKTSRGELRKMANEMKMSPKERELADKLDAKRVEHVKRLESPAGKIDAAAVLATKAVKDCELAARGQVNAELAMRAGFQLISAAVNTYEIKHDAFSDAVVEEFLACLSATAEFVKSVRGF